MRTQYASLAAVLAFGCAAQAPQEAVAPPRTAAPAPEPTVAAPPPAAPAAPAPDASACGPLGCRLYDTPADAFRAVLAQKPLVLAIGEAHAKKDTPGVASSAKRFTLEMLPELKDKASDLVIEIMVPPGGCEAKTKAVKKELGKVTARQADTNQNEYLAMGDEAKKLGIAPHLLYPTCADMKAVSAAGADGILVALTLVGRLMRESAEKLLARNAKEGVEKIVVLYGGAIHNDVEPPPANRDHCFGPQLVAATKGRYVELDVFAPELVGDAGLWPSFAWYPHYDKKAHPDKVTLFTMGAMPPDPRSGLFTTLPASYTMLLPVTRG